MKNKMTIRERMFRRLFRNEYDALCRLERADSQKQMDIRKLKWELEEARQQRKPRPARIKVEDLMPLEDALRKLAGTYNSVPVKAVLAVLNHKLVELADRSTEPPERVSAESRLFESGGAFTAAELLQTLQTAAENQEKTEEKD